MQKKLAVSILSLDPKDYQSMLDRLGENVDIVHFDIMDGHFVPHVSMGPNVVKNIKTNLVKWAHLMVKSPEQEVPKYIEAGANWITFHAEAAHEPTALIHAIKHKGVKAGIAIKPSTHVDDIRDFLIIADHVLIMTVEPGAGGQSFQPENLKKIPEILKLNPHIEIALDGGINLDTLPEAMQAGAQTFVVGSALVRSDDPVQMAKQFKAQMR